MVVVAVVPCVLPSQLDAAEGVGVTGVDRPPWSDGHGVEEFGGVELPSDASR
jgi:hypothetical protein